MPEQVSASQAGAHGKEASWRIVENVTAAAQLRSKMRVQLRPQRQWIAWHQREHGCDLAESTAAWFSCFNDPSHYRERGPNDVIELAC